VTPGAVYKSVNGGSTWSAVDSSSPPGEVLQVWSTRRIPTTSTPSGTPRARARAPTPAPPGALCRSPGLLIALAGARSARERQHLRLFRADHPGIGIGGPAHRYAPISGTAPTAARPGRRSPALRRHLRAGPSTRSTNPSTVYNGLSDRSTNNGATWTVLPASVVNAGGTAARWPSIPAAPSTRPCTTPACTCVARPRAVLGGSSALPSRPSTSIGTTRQRPRHRARGRGGTLYAVLQNYQNSAFVTKLSPDGSSIVFSTCSTGMNRWRPWNLPPPNPESSHAELDFRHRAGFRRTT
jgi:hypothetical protein